MLSLRGAREACSGEQVKVGLNENEPREEVGTDERCAWRSIVIEYARDAVSSLLKNAVGKKKQREERELKEEERGLGR